MAMPGELHPQASTRPASMSTGILPIPVANTGGITKKRGNGLFGVRSNKEVPRTTPTGQPTTTEVVADGRPEGAMSTGGVASAQKGSDTITLRGLLVEYFLALALELRLGRALVHHLHLGTTTSGAFSLKLL